jgi:hypothetical protein
MEIEAAFTKNIHPLDFDAFSHGQISSKLWLCEKLEAYGKTHFDCPISISVYGSWIALLPFLLLSRGQIQIRRFDLYDLDTDAHRVAQKILDFWKFTSDLKINFHTQDCNHLVVQPEDTDLLINTSCEHMEGLQWWDQLPNKTHFCLQSTDMKHPTHISSPVSLDGWTQSLALTPKQISYSGEQSISYTTFSFNRWMLIGKK